MRANMRWWPREYLFLLTHPDSMTPALAALLLEQLGICTGRGSRLAYDRRFDLVRLRWQLARIHRGLPHGRYLFDVLIDNDAYIPLRLTRSQRLRVLVCVRRPVDALEDMLSTGVAATAEQAADLYCARLEWLAAASHNLGERALVFPTEMIVADTNTLLAALVLHLDLPTTFKTVPEPLLEEERDFVTQERWPALSEWEAADGGSLDPLLTARCHETYHYAMQELVQHCLSVGLGRFHSGFATHVWSEGDDAYPEAALGMMWSQTQATVRQAEGSFQ
jgi:hypothetical protein